MTLSFSLSSLNLYDGTSLPKGGLSISRNISFPSFRKETKCHVALPFSKGEQFQLEHVLEAQQFDRNMLDAIFQEAHNMENLGRGSQMLRGYVMSSLFYEPCTRTRFSFESAMKRLGGDVVTSENAHEFSSAKKGETLEDSIKTIAGYSDVIVLRHPEEGAAKRAAAASDGIPIINAGDVAGEHPTQGLQDLYTMKKELRERKKELSELDGLKIALVGDLANGRTVRSLAVMISKYKSVKLYLVAANSLQMNYDILRILKLKNIEFVKSTNLIEVASQCDVIYQTSVQKDECKVYKEVRIVDKKVLNEMQKHAIIMHPFPRLNEIDVKRLTPTQELLIFDRPRMVCIFGCLF